MCRHHFFYRYSSALFLPYLSSYPEFESDLFLIIALMFDYTVA